MSPRTILFLDHAAALGGAEHSLLLLLNRLDPARWHPVLGCTDGPVCAEAVKVSIQTITLNLPRLRRSPTAPADWFAGARAIRQAALDCGAALVYANTVRAALYGIPAARLARLPVLWHMRDFWLSESAPRFQTIDNAAKRLLLAASTAVIANSHAVAARLGGLRKVNVVHNGIDLTGFDSLSGQDQWRSALGLPESAPLVGTAGRLRPWKGQHTFLRAAAGIAEAHPEAHFLVIGGSPFGVDDGYAESLPRLADSLGLADRVTFTGHLADIRRALAALDVFVHPGSPEPFGLVNLEAMALGKPVVGFLHGALPEIVLDGVTGRLVEPGDERALAGAVLELLRDPEKAAVFGKSGRRRVEATFSIELTAEKVEAVLAQVLA